MKIEIKGLKKSYNHRVVLNIQHFLFESGKIIALIGPNGSGKSTFLRILSGIEKPDCGSILFDNKEIMSEAEIAFQPQKPYIFDLSVLKNVMLGMEKNNKSQNEALKALKIVQMESFAKARSTALSGGEAQRMLLARTLALKKQLIILDEPAASIDISSMKMVEDYIKKVNKCDSSTIIFSTHNPSQALRTANKICVLWDGEIIESGSPSEVLKSPKNDKLKTFLEDWRL